MQFMTEQNIARLRENTMEVAAELAKLTGWTPAQYEVLAAAVRQEPWFAVEDTRTYLVECLDAEYDARGGYPGEESDA